MTLPERVKRVGVALSLVAAMGLAGCSSLPDENEVANDWGDVCRTNVDLRQSGRISLDITRYGKDHYNQTAFEMPTACPKLDEMQAGDKIVNEFRWGSFFTEGGSSSSWDMSVKDVLPKPANADESVCTLNMTLRERHAGISPGVFLKDKWNAQEFDWQVPCSVHDKVDVGHNFVTDEWRKGSMGKRLLTNDTGKAVGIWSVEVTGKGGPVPAMQ